MNIFYNFLGVECAENCANVCDYVCANKGRTYKNECLIKIDSFMTNKLIQKFHNGKCRKLKTSHLF